jgi:hypothetical protein
MFKKLIALPEMVRNEDKAGYTYSEEFIGKIFEYKDQYIYFKESAYENMNKNFIETLVNFKVKENFDTVLSENSIIDRINSRFDDFLEIVNEKTSAEDLVSVQQHLEAQILQIKNELSEMVSNELKAAHENMNTELESITENMQKKTVESENKVPLGKLFALKEAGYTAKEIADLKKENLI